MDVSRRSALSWLVGVGAFFMTRPAFALGAGSDFDRAVYLIRLGIDRLARGEDRFDRADLHACCEHLGNPGKVVPELQRVTMHCFDGVLRVRKSLSGIDDRTIERAFAQVAVAI